MVLTTMMSSLVIRPSQVVILFLVPSRISFWLFLFWLLFILCMRYSILLKHMHVAIWLFVYELQVSYMFVDELAIASYIAREYIKRPT